MARSSDAFCGETTVHGDHAGDDVPTGDMEVRTITSRVLLVGTVALWFIQSGPRAEEKEIASPMKAPFMAENEPVA